MGSLCAPYSFVINKSIATGEDVIVILWSYGGVVGTEAVLPSMLKLNRERERKSGGVVHLVFLAAPALKVGMSVKRSNPVQRMWASLQSSMKRRGL